MAKEDRYYFSHDYGARHDPNLTKLFMKEGMAGIGIYWCIIEMLYEQNGYLILSELNTYAFALRTDCDSINRVISDYDLFVKTDDEFYSESVLRRLNIRHQKSEKARENANKRWNNADALQPHCERNAIKEKKGKEKKGKEINISFDEFWDLYEKKVGDKTKLIAKWNKLTDEERTAIMNHIPKYKLSQPDKKYRKNPETFLNNKSWNDELILPETQEYKKPQWQIELEELQDPNWRSK